ncbi:MAG: aldehyde dehydrogenase family protein, partial [Bdellovibrionota bacterium]
KDLGKSRHESFLTEIAPVLDEIHFARKNLRRWMKPRKTRTPLPLQPGTSHIYKEPVGISLVIAPWNYPFMLAISPLVGSFAAGCCAVLKPSEVSSHTSKLLSRILSEAFPEDYLKVVEGGVQETTLLLEQKFDHIFFTGSTAVGKIVALAAAKNLTPCTLELGGKSPAVVCHDADVHLAARRLVWGKFLNAGQTCVAPDYLYVHKSVYGEFIECARAQLKEFYGDSPATSLSYSKIINSAHFDRLKKYLSNAKVITGGEANRETSYIAPTLLEDVNWQSEVMKDEIFGPILPVLKFENLGEVIAEINSREKPLAAYIFTKGQENREKFLNEVSFGGGCVNDTIMHLGSAYLPFGGVGGSGSGSYHGEKSFLTFTHEKSVLKKSGFLDLAIRYPPYAPWKLKFLKALAR